MSARAARNARLALAAQTAQPALGLGFACGFLLSGSTLITNDYFDLEVDRINAPQRPLPAGILTPAEVIALGLVTALLGLAAAAALRISGLLFGLVVVLTLLPWGVLGVAYRIPILLTDLLIVFFVIRLLRSQMPAEVRSAMRGLYLSGSPGLLAFLIGSLVAV